MRGEVEVEVVAVEEESVKEIKSRAERGILSCTRLQLFWATQWLMRGRLPSSRRVHWYDGRVIRRWDGYICVGEARNEMFGYRRRRVAVIISRARMRMEDGDFVVVAHENGFRLVASLAVC